MWANLFIYNFFWKLDSNEYLPLDTLAYLYGIFYSNIFKSLKRYELLLQLWRYQFGKTVSQNFRETDIFNWNSLALRILPQPMFIDIKMTYPMYKDKFIRDKRLDSFDIIALNENFVTSFKENSFKKKGLPNDLVCSCWNG